MLHSGARMALQELSAPDGCFVAAGVAVGVASCTLEPSWARECLRKFCLQDGTCLVDMLHAIEIRKGGKKVHLKSIAATVGCLSKEILFFDNEESHCRSAAELGATSVLCPRGLSEKAWRLGLRAFPQPGGDIIDMA